MKKSELKVGMKVAIIGECPETIYTVASEETIDTDTVCAYVVDDANGVTLTVAICDLTPVKPTTPKTPAAKKTSMKGVYKIEPRPLSSLSSGCQKLFKMYAEDAGNWSGQPAVGGNVLMVSPRSDNGYMCHLIMADLVQTIEVELNPGEAPASYLAFTPFGVAEAAKEGIDLSWIPYHLLAETRGELWGSIPDPAPLNPSRRDTEKAARKSAVRKHIALSGKITREKKAVKSARAKDIDEMEMMSAAERKAMRTNQSPQHKWGRSGLLTFKRRWYEKR